MSFSLPPRVTRSNISSYSKDNIGSDENSPGILPISPIDLAARKLSENSHYNANSRVPFVKSDSNKGRPRTKSPSLKSSKLDNIKASSGVFHNDNNQSNEPKEIFHERLTSDNVSNSKASLDDNLSSDFDLKNIDGSIDDNLLKTANESDGDLPLFEIYDVSKDLKRLSVSLNSPLSPKNLLTTELENQIDDESMSLLNPYVPFVKVVPPKLGSPLAPNGTPLDLSSVPKRRLAVPLQDDNVSDLNKDVLKLFTLLEYELKNLDPKWECSFLQHTTIEDGQSGETNDHPEGFLNNLSFLASKVFKTRSDHEKNYSKYPWYKLLYDCDHSNDENNTVKIQGNNPDMIPHSFHIEDENFDDPSKSVVAYVKLNNETSH